MSLQPHLTREEFRERAATANRIPLLADVLADFQTPVGVYARLASAGLPAFLFESIEGGEQISRYSFIGHAPRKIFEVYETTTRIHETAAGVTEVPTPADPLKLVEDEIAGVRYPETSGLPPFTGGAVGFLGYEYVHRIESTVPCPEADPHGMPLLYFFLCDTVIIFDHVRQLLRLCTNAAVAPGTDPDAAYGAALAELEALLQRLTEPLALAPLPLQAMPSGPVEPPPGNFTREAFEAIVERAREYIRAGDCIQIVASQRFEQAYPHEPLALYRALRVINPSPYMFILQTPDFALVGASPEVHVKLTGERVEIRPIAGTLPRGATPEADLENERRLLADEKERAEHLMLVDLARNDIGRVCRTGTVEVREYAIIERYSHVMHIVSQVEGQLDGRCNAFDLMRATFPAGTVSGAPKVRAMQIIAEFEQSRRGPYAGALGYFGYEGNLDSCIAIRTALLKENRLFVQSGAGLVADSKPASEFFETLNKAGGMLKAVALSEKIDPV